VTREVFEDRGIEVTLPATFDASIAPETLYERGIAKHKELMPDVFGYLSATKDVLAEAGTPKSARKDRS
jgi:hypothetical protein